MNNIKKIDLDLSDAGADRSYAIHIGKGLLNQATSLLPFDIKDKKIFILYDENVYPYVQVLEDNLAGKIYSSKSLSVKGGEPTKSYDGLQKLLGWLLDNKVDRRSVLIAVGGGVIGDLGGFAASIVMRGIPYVQIPTTLLAQVDSSVGGKTGINTPQGKNLVGSFYQPKAVLCDIGTLGTLPERELQAGYAEIVKYGLINNPEFFNWLEDNGQKLLALDSDAVTHAVETSCKAKADIVKQDEHEGGVRALLNLGHTFGHALEAACEYDGRLLHGEAVSIGMVMAFELSVKMGVCPLEDLVCLKDHLKKCGLKTKAAEIAPQIKQSAQELVEKMGGDKKAQGGKIGFILVRGIGQAFQTYDVDINDVTEIVKNSLEG